MGQPNTEFLCKSLAQGSFASPRGSMEEHYSIPCHKVAVHPPITASECQRHGRDNSDRSEKSKVVET